MIKKKLISSVATAAILTSLLATSAFAEDVTQPWNTQGGSAEAAGSNSVVEPTIEVAVPGDLTFAINPLKLNVSEDESNPNTAQIVADSYPIVNYSNVPVVVGTKTKAKGSSDVVFATDGTRDTNSKELPAVKDKKNVFLCVAADKTATFSEEDGGFTYTFGDVTETVKDEDTAKAEAMHVLDGTDTAKEIKFKLAAASGKNEAGETAALTIKGIVDPQAAFAEEDVSVNIVYTLSVITKDQYDNAYEEDDTLTGAATAVKAKS